MATNALITRRFPAGGDGHDDGLPRRDRDPARHEGRPLGRLQGRRAAVHPAPRPARGDRAGRLRRRRSSSRSTRRRRARSRALLRRAGRRRSPSASSTPTPTRRNEQRMREILEEELAGRDRLDLERGAARDLRARALLDHRRERGAAAARRRLHRAGSRSALASGGYDGDLLLLHSGGGVMTPKSAERLAVRLAASGIAAGAIASRHIAHALRVTRTRSGSTWAARRPTSRSSTSGEARTDEGVVRRVRLPDRLPVDRGADDRRRRRVARLDRRGRLAAQRPAVGGRRARPRLLRARRRAGRRTPTRTSCSAGSETELIGGAMTLDRGGGRARDRATRWPSRSGCDVDECGEARSCRSRTRTWPTRSA